jgi:hypothetical protein
VRDATTTREVDIQGRRVKVRAHIGEGDERATLSAAMSALYAGFDEYRTRTNREPLVFVLTPKATKSAE